MIMTCEGDRCFAWNVVVVKTLVESYRTWSAVGAAVEIGTGRKYAIHCHFVTIGVNFVVPLVFETLGPVNQCGFMLIKLFHYRCAHVSGDEMTNRLRFLWAPVYRYPALQQNRRSCSFLINKTNYLQRQSSTNFFASLRDHNFVSMERNCSTDINNNGLSTLQHCRGTMLGT